MPNTDWLKLNGRPRQGSVSFRCKKGVKRWPVMYCCGKQEINFAIFPFILKVSLRGAVPSLLDGHDALAVLDSVEFYFPSLCNCSWNGTRETSNRVGFVSPAEHHQRPDFRGKKYGLVSFLSCRLIFEGVEICKLVTTIVVHGPGQVPGTTKGAKTWVISEGWLCEGLFEFTWYQPWNSSFHNSFDLETRLTGKQLY